MTLRASPHIEKLTDTRRRIHRAVDFIDEHIDRKIALAELADIACISRCHFPRVYGGLVGQSPSETLRRLRLLRARDRIVLDGISPAEAAREAGFSRLHPFIRAYREEFDREPTEIRVSAQQMPRPRPLLNFTIVERSTQQMFGISYDGERAAMDPLTVDAQAYARYLAGDENVQALAIYHDDFLTPYHRNFRCDIGISLDKPEMLAASRSFVGFVSPAGLHACVEQRGLLLDLAPYWEEFVGDTLPRHGWRRRSGPVLRWFVSDRAVTPPSQRLAYLYVPVERAATH